VLDVNVVKEALDVKEEERAYHLGMDRGLGSVVDS
jgi:hypothetical protein